MMTAFLAHTRRYWRQYLPLAAIAVVGAVLFFAAGLHRELTFDALALRYAALEETIAAAPVLSFLIAMAVYAAIVMFAIPGVWILSVAYGLLFGWVWGIPLVLLGATLGASILYWAARTAFSDYFRKRAGPMLSRLAEGFRENAASYLLFLRFAPMFPFVIVNVAPAVLGVSYRTFLWTTLVGIGPGTAVYAYAGEGLRNVVAERAEACLADAPPCGEPLMPWDILTPQILVAFALLAVVSLVPVLLRLDIRRARR